MIPNPYEVSAFAVYSGLVGTSKSKQRRNRHKKQLDNNKVSEINGLCTGDKTKLHKTIKKSSLRNKQSSSKILISKNRNSLIVKHSTGSKKKGSRVNGQKKNNRDNGSSIEVFKSSNDLDNVETNDGDENIVKNLTKLNKVVDIDSGKSKLAKRNENSECIGEISINSDNINVRSAKKKKTITERIMRIRPDVAEKKRLLREEVKDKLKGKSSTSSLQIGKLVFESLISPFKATEFFSEYWEKKPLHIDRGGESAMYSQYLSTEEMDTMLRYNMLMFGRNVDITSYADGVRETHNPEGRAHPHVVWDYYSNGCSVRILNPQTYLNKIHTLLAAMQEYFGCFVGSNIYLTPANTQGFAPHYDDIEAFVLQIEGSKRWRVYKPLTPREELPRYSSQNFSQEEIGTPILDIILRPGDLLYFPRGFIHQAEALPDQHSLHITISTYQKTTWLDLLEQAIPVALARASDDNIDFRRGLPIGYLRGAGLAHPTSSLRCEMISKLKKLVFQLEKHMDIDDAVDKLGISFIHQSLPPVLSKDEASCSVHNGGLKLSEGEILNRVDITLNTKVRWVRANAFRIVEDSDNVSQVRLYHCIDNSKEYEAEEVQFIVLDKSFLRALSYLVKAYPAYSSVSQLPCSSDDEKLILAGDLWDRGLLIADSPLSIKK